MDTSAVPSGSKYASIRPEDPQYSTSGTSSTGQADPVHKKKRGVFVVVEGLDRAGKDTIISRLARLLEDAGELVLVQAFPDRTTPSGITLDQFLQRRLELDDWSCHNLYAQNRRELVPKLHDALMAGVTVLCSRYAYSGVAYTAAKGHDLHQCMEADRGLLRPDLVVFLDIGAETVAGRNAFGKERFETEVFQAKVYAAFQDLWKHLDGCADSSGYSGAGSNSVENKPRLLRVRPKDMEDVPAHLIKLIAELKETRLSGPVHDLFNFDLILS